jgi:hypothetical protein
VVARSWTLEERISELGSSPISITFEISNTDGKPQARTTAASQVANLADTALAAANQNIEDNLEATPSFAGNFADAIEKVEAIAADVDAAVTRSAADPTEVDQFFKLLKDLDEDAPTLVSAPADLGDSVQDIMEAMDDFHTTPEDSLIAFKRLFTFGLLDVGFAEDTAGRVERQSNRDTLNGSMRGSALSQAYRNATRVTLTTVDDVDELKNDLEAEYQSQITAGILGDDLEEAVTQLRITTNQFLDEQRVTRPQVVTVRTNPTSSRLLAFQYYGASDRGDEITTLNSLRNPADVSGQVKILSS